MTDIVHVENLVKRYDDLIALDHFNLSIAPGEIFGLLGPNGSGKTTSINCILQLLAYDKGTIELFGEPMTPARYNLKRRMGVVPQQVAVFDELTVRENIDYFCSLYVNDRSAAARGGRGDRLCGLGRLYQVSPRQAQAAWRVASTLPAALRTSPSSSSLTSLRWQSTRRVATPSSRASAACATRAPRWCIPAITWRKSSRFAAAS
ncbi:MAG: ATP-binding cassette domain-containing protein [Collinsella sp.]